MNQVATMSGPVDRIKTVDEIKEVIYIYVYLFSCLNSDLNGISPSELILFF
jgi:hypothetical protein